MSKVVYNLSEFCDSYDCQKITWSQNVHFHHFKVHIGALIRVIISPLLYNHTLLVYTTLMVVQSSSMQKYIGEYHLFAGV